MRKILATLLLAVVPVVSQAHELGAAFGDSVAVSSQGDLAIVEYCPDNTCEVFTLRGPSATLPLQDFAFAYLLGVSEYLYLESFQADTKSPAIRAVLGRYRSHCPQPPSPEAARCVVGYLASIYPIKASFVRYDEGERNVVPIPLEGFRHGT
ncbi:hypothetical protein MQC88_10435, partial [Luteimonas sp. 50]